jgi:hypothetical protein
MRNLNLRYVLSSLVLSGFMFSCTPQAPTTSKVVVPLPKASEFKIKTTFGKSGVKSTESEGLTAANVDQMVLMHIALNVSGPGFPQKVVSWDLCDQGMCDGEMDPSMLPPAPTQMTVPAVPFGENRIVQALFVFSGGSSEDGEQMMFFYGDAIKSFSSPEESVVVDLYPAITDTTNVQMAELSGRFSATDGTFPSGIVNIMFQPPAKAGVERPPMTIEQSELVNGWGRLFAISAIDFTYQMESGKTIAKGVNFNSDFLKTSDSKIKINTPSTVYEGWGGDSYYERDRREQAIMGFFGAGASGKVVCLPQAQDLVFTDDWGYSFGLYADQNGTPMKWQPSGTGTGIISATGGVVKTDTKCQGKQLFVDRMDFNLKSFIDNSDGGMGFDGIFGVVEGGDRWNPIQAKLNDAQDGIQVEWSLLPGLSDINEIEFYVFENAWMIQEIFYGREENACGKIAGLPEVLGEQFGSPDAKRVSGPTRVAANSGTVNLTYNGNGGELTLIACPRSPKFPNGYVNSHAVATWVDGGYGAGGGGGTGDCYDCGSPMPGPVSRIDIKSFDQAEVGSCNKFYVSLVDVEGRRTSSDQALSFNFDSNSTITLFTDSNCSGQLFPGNSVSFASYESTKELYFYMPPGMADGETGSIDLSFDGNVETMSVTAGTVESTMTNSWSLRLMAYKDFVESGECLQFEATLMDSNGIPATTSEQFSLEAYVSQSYQFYSDGNCSAGSETTSVDFSSNSSQYFFLKVNWSEPFEVKVWANAFGDVWQGYRVNDYYNGETNYQYMAGPRAELYWNNSGTMEPLPYSLPLSDCLQLELHTLDQDGNPLNMSETALTSMFDVSNGLFYSDGSCTDGTGTTSAIFSTAVDSSVSNQVYFKPNGVGYMNFNMNNSSGGATDLSLEWHYSDHFVAGSALVLNHSGGGLLQPGSSYGNEQCLALIVRPGDIADGSENYPANLAAFSGTVSVDLGSFYTDSGCNTGQTSSMAYSIDANSNVSNETLYYKGGTGISGDATFTLTKTTGDAGYNPMSHWIYVDSGGGGGSFYFTYADANITDEGVQIGMYCYPNMVLDIILDIGDNASDDGSISTNCSASGDYFFYLSDFTSATGTYASGDSLKIYANSNGDYTEMFTTYGSGSGGSYLDLYEYNAGNVGWPGTIGFDECREFRVMAYTTGAQNPLSTVLSFDINVNNGAQVFSNSTDCSGNVNALGVSGNFTIAASVTPESNSFWVRSPSSGSSYNIDAVFSSGGDATYTSHNRVLNLGEGGGMIKYTLMTDMSGADSIPDTPLSPNQAVDACLELWIVPMDESQSPVNFASADTINIGTDMGSILDGCAGSAMTSVTVAAGDPDAGPFYLDLSGAGSQTALVTMNEVGTGMVHEQSFSVGTYPPYFVSPSANPSGMDMMDLRCTNGSGSVTLEIWDAVPQYFDEMTFPDCMDGMIKAPLSAFVMIRDNAGSWASFDLKAADMYGTGAMGQLTWQGLGASVHFMDDTGASPYRSLASSTDCVPFKLVNTDAGGAALNQTSGSDWNFQVHSEFGQFSFNSDCSAMQPGIQVTITNGTSSSPVFYYTPNGNSGPAMIMAHSPEASIEVATMLEGSVSSGLDITTTNVASDTDPIQIVGCTPSANININVSYNGSTPYANSVGCDSMGNASFSLSIFTNFISGEAVPTGGLVDIAIDEGGAIVNRQVQYQ